LDDLGHVQQFPNYNIIIIYTKANDWMLADDSEAVEMMKVLACGGMWSRRRRRFCNLLLGVRDSDIISSYG